MHYTSCALYFYYCYISSTSDHQHQILEIGDPCIRKPTSKEISWPARCSQVSTAEPNAETPGSTKSASFHRVTVSVLVTQLCPTLCDPMEGAARQAPLSMGLSRQSTRVSSHFLLRGIFPTQGWNLCPLNWQADSVPPEPPVKPTSSPSASTATSWHQGHPRPPPSLPSQIRFTSSSIQKPTPLSTSFFWIS